MNEQIKPRFEVHKLEGTRLRTLAKSKVKLDDKGKVVLNKDDNPILLGGFEYEDVKHDAGWMIYFPSGSSIHVWTEEEMVRQGFLTDPELVNMETGDLMGKADSQSLKARSEQKEIVTKSSTVHHVN